jgi:hypothetical protein
MSANPYQAPETFDIPQARITDAEAIRETHLKTEASIKSIGILYWLAAIALVITSLPLITAAAAQSEEGVTLLATGVGLLLVGILQFVVGFEIRKLKSWTRIAAGIMSGIGLLAFPIGTVINAYILFLLLGRKGKMVFSAPYQEIMAATPHIKYKTSKWVWMILIVAVLFFGGMAIFAAIQK